MFLILGVLLTSPLTAQDLEPAKTSALVVGISRWDDPSVTSLPADARQDRELFEALQDREIPRSRAQILTDGHATLSGIKQALFELGRGVPAGGTLILYYAGRASRQKDETVLLPYDYRASDWKKTGLTLTRLGDWLEASLPRGARTLLITDCGYSDGLKRLANRLQVSGRPVATLVSTGNNTTRISPVSRTLTTSLIASLLGDPLVDTNGDGIITLGEAAGEARGALKHWDGARSSFHTAGLAAGFQLASARRPESKQARSGLHPLGAYVSARVDGTWRTGRIVGWLRNRHVVRIRGGTEWTDVLLDPSRVKAKVHKTYRLGSHVRFRSNGKVRVGRILQVEDDFHLVAASGEPTEWVLSDRILGLFATSVSRITREAQLRASLGGRYSTLSKRIHVPADRSRYGDFNAYGFWSGTSYAGHYDLPVGYWVYVYPHWYLWKTDGELGQGLRPLKGR